MLILSEYMAPLHAVKVEALYVQNTLRPRSSLKTDLARQQHVNITPVITAVNFGQTLAPLNLGWSFRFRTFWIEIDT